MIRVFFEFAKGFLYELGSTWPVINAFLLGGEVIFVANNDGEGSVLFMLVIELLPLFQVL